jgi:hypothetical protein
MGRSPTPSHVVEYHVRPIGLRVTNIAAAKIAPARTLFQPHPVPTRALVSLPPSASHIKVRTHPR